MKQTIKGLSSHILIVAIIAFLICNIWLIYETNKAYDDFRGELEETYEAWDELKNGMMLRDYERLLGNYKTLNMTSDTDYSEEIGYLTDEIENYEPINFYSGKHRMDPFTKSVLQLIPIAIVSVICYFIGRNLGKIKTKEANP